MNLVPLVFMTLFHFIEASKHLLTDISLNVTASLVSGSGPGPGHSDVDSLLFRHWCRFAGELQIIGLNFTYGCAGAYKTSWLTQRLSPVAASSPKSWTPHCCAGWWEWAALLKSCVCFFYVCFFKHLAEYKSHTAPLWRCPLVVLDVLWFLQMYLFEIQLYFFFLMFLSK